MRPTGPVIASGPMIAGKIEMSLFNPSHPRMSNNSPRSYQSDPQMKTKLQTQSDINNSPLIQ